MERLPKRLQVARGEVPAELVLTGGRVANVYTGEWQETDVALFDGVIVGLGDYPGPRLDVTGRYLLPGFIDGHLHMESSMLTPRELRGPSYPWERPPWWPTPMKSPTSGALRAWIICWTPVKACRWIFSSCCPPACPPLTWKPPKRSLEAGDLEPYRRHPRVLGLAEMMNFPGLVNGDPKLLDKLALFPHGPVDGHAPLLYGMPLNAYRLAGIGSDHECTCLAEAKEKLRLGFYLMLREGSLAKNLADLLPAVTQTGLRRAMLVTDDSHPEDLARTGHLNHLLRQAVSLGLDPLAAVTMATLNPAEYFRLRDRGAVATGLAADLVVAEDLTEFRIDKVFKDGHLLVDRGRLLAEPDAPPRVAPSSPMRVNNLGLEAFSPPAAGSVVKVIGLIPGQLLTEKRLLPAPVKNGRLATSPEQDISETCRGGTASRYRPPGTGAGPGVRLAPGWSLRGSRFPQYRRGGGR